MTPKYKAEREDALAIRVNLSVVARRPMGFFTTSKSPGVGRRTMERGSGRISRSSYAEESLKEGSYFTRMFRKSANQRSSWVPGACWRSSSNAPGASWRYSLNAPGAPGVQTVCKPWQSPGSS